MDDLYLSPGLLRFHVSIFGWQTSNNELVWTKLAQSLRNILIPRGPVLSAPVFSPRIFPCLLCFPSVLSTLSLLPPIFSSLGFFFQLLFSPWKYFPCNFFLSKEIKSWQHPESRNQSRFPKIWFCPLFLVGLKQLDFCEDCKKIEWTI